MISDNLEPQNKQCAKENLVLVPFTARQAPKDLKEKSRHRIVTLEAKKPLKFVMQAILHTSVLLPGPFDFMFRNRFYH
jgi:hypothetical protein